MLLFGACMVLHILDCFHVYGAAQGPRSALWTVVSLTGTLVLLWWSPGAKWLQALGAFSFAIYLHHVFFTTGARFALRGIGIDSGVPTYFVTALIFGIAGPVLLEKALERHDLARRLLFGRA